MIFGLLLLFVETSDILLILLVFKLDVLIFKGFLENSIELQNARHASKFYYAYIYSANITSIYLFQISG